MLFGYPNFSFILNAIGKLYLGKTTDGTILNVRKEKYNKRILGDTKNKKFTRMSNTSEPDETKYSTEEKKT